MKRTKMENNLIAGEMTVKDYKDLLDLVITLSMDAECFSLDGNFDYDEVKKCRVLKKIIEVVNDVPAGRVRWILGGMWKGRS